MSRLPGGLQPQCPKCGKTLDGFGSFTVQGVELPQPVNGDTTVCAYCFVPLMFTKDMQLEIISLEAFAMLPARLQRDLNVTIAALSRRQKSMN